MLLLVPIGLPFISYLSGKLAVFFLKGSLELIFFIFEYQDLYDKESNHSAETHNSNMHQ